MPTAEQILTWIEKQERSSGEVALRQRIEDDYKLFRGTLFVPPDGYDAFTDNTPQLQSSTTTAVLAKSNLRIWCPIDIDKKKERNAKNLSERFVLGYIDAVDLMLRRRGEPGLLPQLSWWAPNRGWICFRPLIYKNSKGNTDIDFQFLDRLWLTYEMGNEGPKWVAYKRPMNPSQIYSIYGIAEMRDRDISERIDVVDFWDDEQNSIIIDKDFYKPPTDHQIGFNPNVILPTGFTPLTASTVSTDTLKDVGESVFKNGRNLHTPNNIIKSAWLTQAYRYRKPPAAAESSDGNFIPEGNPFQSGAMIPLNRNKAQNIRPIDLPELPKDFYSMAQLLDSQVKASGPEFPYTGISGGSTAWSGLALNVAAHSSSTAIDPFRITIEAAYEELAWNITRMFSSSFEESNLGLKPIELIFQTEKGMSIHKFKPDEVKPFRFRAELKLDMPTDEMQPWLKARIAREGPNPMLSEQTVLEEVIKVPDVEAERSKKLEEFALNIPTVKLREVFFALVEQMDAVDAQQVLTAVMGGLGMGQAIPVLMALSARQGAGDSEAIRIALAVAMELEVMERKQWQEYQRILAPTPGQMGAMAPQPPQAPMQGLNNASALPQGGIPPGMGAPMAQSPGMMMSPEQEIALRMAGA